MSESQYEPSVLADRKGAQRFSVDQKKIVILFEPVDALDMISSTKQFHRCQCATCRSSPRVVQS